MNEATFSKLNLPFTDDSASFVDLDFLNVFLFLNYICANLFSQKGGGINKKLTCVLYMYVSLFD